MLTITPQMWSLTILEEANCIVTCNLSLILTFRNKVISRLQCRNLTVPVQINMQHKSNSSQNKLEEFIICCPLDQEPILSVKRFTKVYKIRK